MISKEQLTNITLAERETMPDSYSCHEAARRFNQKITSMGIDSVVKDGLVTYHTTFFQDRLVHNDFFMNAPDDVRKELLQIDRIKSKIKVFHSWIELIEDNAENMVVDWHFSLRLSKQLSVRNVLIVDRKGRLPHTYNPVAKQMGKWIVSIFPPYVARLKI